MVSKTKVLGPDSNKWSTRPLAVRPSVRRNAWTKLLTPLTVTPLDPNAPHPKACPVTPLSGPYRQPTFNNVLC